MSTRTQENRSYSVVTAEAAEAPVAMLNIVSILGPDILGDIFDFLTLDTIIDFDTEARNKGDNVSLRSIEYAFDNWKRNRDTYVEEMESIFDLGLSHLLVLETIVTPSKSTVLDNIFEYLSENDISNLKQTDMLSDDCKKNPLYLKFMKIKSSSDRGMKKWDEYFDIDDADADADADVFKSANASQRRKQYLCICVFRIAFIIIIIIIIIINGIIN